MDGLEVTIPTDQNHASVVALVECALVELTHEAVGAVFVSQQVGRSTRTQYVAADDVGEQFQKRRFDDRLGWHETTVLNELFATNSSPSSRGRPRCQRSGQVREQPASQTSSS